MGVEHRAVLWAALVIFFLLFFTVMKYEMAKEARENIEARINHFTTAYHIEQRSLPKGYVIKDENTTLLLASASCIKKYDDQWVAQCTYTCHPYTTKNMMVVDHCISMLHYNSEVQLGQSFFIVKHAGTYYICTKPGCNVDFSTCNYACVGTLRT